MGLADFLEIVKTLGLPVALLLLFVYFDIQRRAKDAKEKTGLVERLAALEEHQRTELQKLVVENTTALQNHAEASREMIQSAREQTQIHRQLITALRTRPCLENTIDHIEGTH